MTIVPLSILIMACLQITLGKNTITLEINEQSIQFPQNSINLLLHVQHENYLQPATLV